jgi:hypothetical protein
MSSGRLWMVGALKVWLHVASTAWLEMQHDKDGKALKRGLHLSPHGAGERANSAIVASNSIRLRNTSNDSQHPQILE